MPKRGCCWLCLFKAGWGWRGLLGARHSVLRLRRERLISEALLLARLIQGAREAFLALSSSMNCVPDRI